MLVGLSFDVPKCQLTALVESRKESGRIWLPANIQLSDESLDRLVITIKRAYGPAGSKRAAYPVALAPTECTLL